MELNELKYSWEQYDKKLSENLKFNEELLRRSNLDHSKREMNTPLSLIMTETILECILLLLLVGATIRFGADGKYLLSGVVSSVLLLLSVVVAILEIRELLRMDYYSAPVLELQKRLTNFQRFYRKEKKIGFFLLPVFLAAALPVLVIWVKKWDILAYPAHYFGTVGVMLLVAYPLAIWIYREFYDKKVRSARQFLSELEEFEKE